MGDTGIATCTVKVNAQLSTIQFGVGDDKRIMSYLSYIYFVSIYYLNNIFKIKSHFRFYYIYFVSWKLLKKLNLFPDCNCNYEKLNKRYLTIIYNSLDV